MHGVDLVLWRVGAIPGNGCGVQGQDCVAVHQGKEIWAGFNYGDWMYTYILVKLGVDTSGTNGKQAKIPIQQSVDRYPRDANKDLF